MANRIAADADLSATITHLRQQMSTQQPVSTEQEEATFRALQEIHTLVVGRTATQAEIDAA